MGQRKHHDVHRMDGASRLQHHASRRLGDGLLVVEGFGSIKETTD